MQIDAARIDGATPMQVQRNVIFWQLPPVIEFWTVLILIISFTAFFPLIYTLTGGGPGFATYTVDFDLYKEAFTTGALGYASAIGVTMLWRSWRCSARSSSLSYAGGGRERDHRHRPPAAAPLARGRWPGSDVPSSWSPSG